MQTPTPCATEPYSEAVTCTTHKLPPTGVTQDTIDWLVVAAVVVSIGVVLFVTSVLVKVWQVRRDR